MIEHFTWIIEDMAGNFIWMIKDAGLNIFIPMIAYMTGHFYLVITDMIDTFYLDITIFTKMLQFLDLLFLFLLQEKLNQDNSSRLPKLSNKNQT